jgi:hypothetical protein
VAGAQIAGLALQDAVILSDRSTGVRQGLAIGMSAARGDPLLPTAFVQRLTARPHGQPVQLGRYSAYRYAGLREGKADRVLTAYAIPTDHGTATVVCFSPAAGSAAFMTRCTRAAGTIGLTGVRAFALGPDPRFAARVNAVLAVFVPARTKILKGFAASKSAAAQAVAATKVANLYASARRRVATGSVSPELAPARQAITDALARTSLAYRALAAAARHQSPPRYRQAAKAVVTAGRRVAASFARLRSLGYRVRSG